MARKLRSPLRGMTVRNITMYRYLAVATVLWERDAAAEQYRHLPYAHQILKNDGGTWQMQVLDDFEKRALRRLQARDNWPVIHEQRRIEHLRRWNPKAYETAMLRKEVAMLRAELAERHLDRGCRA